MWALPERSPWVFMLQAASQRRVPFADMRSITLGMRINMS